MYLKLTPKNVDTRRWVAIGYCHDNVVCLSVCLSVTLCIAAEQYILLCSKSVWTSE